jgi:hypothetical protein
MAPRPLEAYCRGMIPLSDDVRLLLDRYCECILIRHAEGVYDLHTARTELVEAFGQLGHGETVFRSHIQAVIEAGDEA